MAISSRASSSPSAGHFEALSADVRIATILIAVCCALALGLGGCKRVLNSGNESDESFHVRMLNLLEDSPAVQYKIDTTAITSIGYLTGTALSPAHVGSHTVSFAAIRPASLDANDSTDPIPLPGSFDQSYSQGRDYTIFVYGTIDNPRTFTMDEQSDKPAVDDDFIEYQFVNASTRTPSVDIFITAPDGQINSPQKLATLNLGEKTTTTTLKLFKRPDVTDANADLFADFTIELRDPITGDELFDSDKIRLNEKTRLLWVLTNDIGPGSSKVRLVTLDGGNGAVVPDKNSQAAVRVVHVSPDSGNFDVFADSTLKSPIATDIAFRDKSAYTPVPKGDVDLFALPASSTGVILFVEEFTATAGTSSSGYAVGRQGSTDFFVTADDRRSVPTQSSFRFLNVAPSESGLDGLDVFVTLPGQTIDFNASTSTTADDAATFKKGTILYKAVPTPAIVLRSGTYQVRMARTGTSNIVLDTSITVQDGSVTTFALIDDPETASLELMPVEDALTQ
jgi:uncharacterized protein DUF4397